MKKKIFSIRRLLDRDSRGQRNLTFWALAEVCAIWDIEFSDRLKNDIEQLDMTTSTLKTHRHKRIAHYDLDVSLKRIDLPPVILSGIREAIEAIECIVNSVAQHACKTTIFFEVLDHRDITTKAEVAVAKATAYDSLVIEGTIDKVLWRKYIK